jgi:hypothetical protein
MPRTSDGGRARASSTTTLVVLLSLLFQALFLPLAHAAIAQSQAIGWLEVCSSEGLRLVPVELATLAEDDAQRELLVQVACPDCLATIAGMAIPPSAAGALAPATTDDAVAGRTALQPSDDPRTLRPPSRASPR